MTTSANATIYVVRDASGRVVGRHSHHCFRKARWEELLRFRPLSSHTIQWTWLDEDEVRHERDPEPLLDFIREIAENEERLEELVPAYRARRERNGIPPPMERYLGEDRHEREDDTEKDAAGVVDYPGSLDRHVPAGLAAASRQ